MKIRMYAARMAAFTPNLVVFLKVQSIVERMLVVNTKNVLWEVGAFPKKLLTVVEEPLVALERTARTTTRSALRLAKPNAVKIPADQGIFVAAIATVWPTAQSIVETVIPALTAQDVPEAG